MTLKDYFRNKWLTISNINEYLQENPGYITKTLKGNYLLSYLDLAIDGDSKYYRCSDVIDLDAMRFTSIRIYLPYIVSLEEIIPEAQIKAGDTA
ncbi:MAG: hypothetical protein ACM3MK_11300 [Chitinophagales bacterium]